jgi:hypothetical protein
MLHRLLPPPPPEKHKSTMIPVNGETYYIPPEGSLPIDWKTEIHLLGNVASTLERDRRFSLLPCWVYRNSDALESTCELDVRPPSLFVHPWDTEEIGRVSEYKYLPELQSQASYNSLCRDPTPLRSCLVLGPPRAIFCSLEAMHGTTASSWICSMRT